MLFLFYTFDETYKLFPLKLEWIFYKMNIHLNNSLQPVYFRMKSWLNVENVRHTQWLIMSFWYMELCIADWILNNIPFKGMVANVLMLTLWNVCLSNPPICMWNYSGGFSWWNGTAPRKHITLWYLSHFMRLCRLTWIQKKQIRNWTKLVNHVKQVNINHN
jgi:hypothetical protein